MKKTLFLGIMAFPCLLLSCKDGNEEIMDGCRMSEDLYIVIQNADGENLLNPAIDGSLAGTFQAEFYCEGEKYDLDWSIMDHPNFKDYPQDDYITPLPEMIGKIPGVISGFRYYSVPVKEMINDYPAQYFLVFGDFNVESDWRREMHVSFPSLDKEYDIVWDNRGSGGKVITVNGERISGSTINIVI